MTRDQKRARVFGVLYLITFVTSIAALVLYETVLRRPERYIAGGGHDKQVLLGTLLELFLIIANVGTAVVLFTIVLSIVRGEGPYLFAADGSRYLDFASGIAVNALGHCHPHVVAALVGPRPPVRSFVRRSGGGQHVIDEGWSRPGRSPRTR